MTECWTDLFPAGDKHSVRCFLTCIQAFCHQNCSLMAVITNKLRKLEKYRLSIYGETITSQFIMYHREVERYGREKVTPNMHLQTHLLECILDYGPVYSFWLFSFERYKGIIGQFKTNQRIIYYLFIYYFIYYLKFK